MGKSQIWSHFYRKGERSLLSHFRSDFNYLGFRGYGGSQSLQFRACASNTSLALAVATPWCTQVFDRRAELATALAENGVAAMRQLCPGGGSGTSAFEAALSQEEPSPMVAVLQRFYASHAELESISLAAAVLRLYMFVHEELNVHFQGTLSLQAATDRSLTSVFDEYLT